jgi:hypothetical protein
MSWQEDFDSAPVWASAAFVDEQLATLVHGQRIDPMDGQVERLRALVARVMVQRGDPDITITPHSLQVVDRLLREIMEVLPDVAEAAFKSRRRGSVTTPSRFDQIVEEVRHWPQSSSGKIAGLSQILANAEASTARMVAQVRSQYLDLDQQASVLREQLREGPSAQAVEATRVLAEAQRRIADFEREIGVLFESGQQQSARIDQAIRAHQETFTQEERLRTDEATEAASRRADEWQEELSQAQRGITEHLTEMDGYAEQSRNVLAAVGVNSTATFYGGYAKDQAKLANAWRFVAVGILALAGAWFVASSIFPTLHGQGALWEQAISRLGITAAVAGVGLYAARESSQHREQERRARRAELVLTALDPFIVNLEPERAHKIRDEAARALFVAEPAGKTSDGSPADYLTLIGDVVQRIPTPTRTGDS